MDKIIQTSESKETNIFFLFSMHQMGMRSIHIHVAIYNRDLLNQNVTTFFFLFFCFFGQFSVSMKNYGM